MTITSVYPLESGRLYTIGELRAAEATLLAERQANQGLSDRLRVQDRKEIDWAKLRNEEWSPLMLLVNGLGLDDADTFRWTPAGAADFVIAFGESIRNVQCTMAYDEPEDTKYRRGHLHHLEMKHQREKGFYFGGGKISEPNALDVMEQLSTWRAGIVSAVGTKLAKTNYVGQQLNLLVYARKCSFDLIDFSLAEVVVPALDAIGKKKWGRVFVNIYIVDNEEFVHVAREQTSSASARPDDPESLPSSHTNREKTIKCGSPS
jgi:hypothetical protein